MKISPLKLLSLVLFCCVRLGAAPVVSYHFDSPEDVAALKNPKITWTAETKVAGAGAAVLDAVNTDGGGCSFALPKDKPEGVLTWWVYDPIFERAKGSTGLGCSFSGVADQDGKKVGKVYKLDDFIGHSYGGWAFGTDLLKDRRETSVIRHSGWTRFDVVKPPGAEPQQLIVYIDGREAARTRDKFYSLDSLGISDGGHVFVNVSIPIFFDEISYDDSAASFRPSAVQALSPKWTTLKAGEKLPVQIALDPKGARASEGEVTVKLYDGAERELCQAKADIDWAKQGDKPLTVDLVPPRSGWFWVEACYTDKGLTLPDVVRSRVDAQYLAPGFEKLTQEKIVFDTPWDFLPAVSSEAVAPPKDWAGAQRLPGPWKEASQVLCAAADVTNAWYHRTVEVPSSWAGRRVLLDIYNPQLAEQYNPQGACTGLRWRQDGREDRVAGRSS